MKNNPHFGAFVTLATCNACIGVLHAFSAFVFWLMTALWLLVGCCSLAVESDPSELIPGLVGCVVLVLMNLLPAVFTTVCAILSFWTTYCLVEKEKHGLCMTMAILNCMFIPLGSLVGIAGIILLTRPGVKEAFARSGSDSGTIQVFPRPSVETGYERPPVPMVQFT